MEAERASGAQPRIGLEDVDLPRLGMAAMRIIGAIEQGDTGVLWQAASRLVKETTERDVFVSRLLDGRRSLGRGIGRRWTAVRVDRSRDGGPLPSGTYGALEFSVSLGGPAIPFREIVSLRREDDGVWRLAGYHAVREA
ncbi:DUF4019 domain-containing protein [Pseudoxanthomonas sp. SL93]|uniref:DUF4019 domain-containing protein n=1 Tax=Pseudoxanthomonas sp. SL93 TaxID=2995142 RepID=UPI002271FC65|nr:DUF4019 domain-containing protein [Pseudoxanthomonas sp. SL93]WAC61631.1 DUF4019 domain-containing protein [Pseudoxanthomonas sp. SL93]